MPTINLYTKFSELDVQDTLASVDLIVGIKDNGDGTFTNYTYSYSGIIAAAKTETRKAITATTDSSDLTDSWIDGKDIQCIITQSQAYLLDEDYTQSGDTITGLNITFFTGQKILLIA